MRITVKTGIITALSWIAIKMIVFYSGLLENNIVPLVMLNILGVLIAVAVGLFLHKRKSEEDSNTLSDIKNGMTSGVLYALIISIFLYFYYSKIDPGYNARQINKFETALRKDLNDPIKFKQIKDSNVDFENKEKEEIFDTLVQGPHAFFKAGSTMVISMLSMLLLATINSIFVSAVYRRFIFRKR